MKNKPNQKINLKTSSEITWCPGCPNFMIKAAVEQTITKLIENSAESNNKQAAKPTSGEANRRQSQLTQKDFCITADIGCNSKMFDYLNLSGVYSMHGRSLPAAVGLKLGNPNLKVLAFAGDGGVYSEGISHFIHAFKTNPNLTLILHDNQSFSLTTGQPTPTSQTGYVSKASPLGTFDKPFNPIKLALASNATFIARTTARDIPHMVETFTKAINHNGFSFVEVIQDCLIFNPEANGKDSRMYKIKDNQNLDKAEKLAKEYDYNSRDGKIPIGIIYQNTKEKPLEEKWPQLQKKLKKNKKIPEKKELGLLRKLIPTKS